VTEIRGREELDRSLRDQAETAIRLARLEAELSGKADFALPTLPDGVAPDLALAMAAREKATLEASSAAYTARMDSIARLLAARVAEIEALEGRLESSARQTALIEEEIVDARDLLERGLTPISRLNGLLREADSQQSDVLQIRVLLNQARQAVAELELEQQNAPRERQISLSQQIAEASARLAAARLSVTAATDLLAESGAPAAVIPGQPGVLYRIEREGGTETIETDDGSTAVLPGDLVSVLRLTARTGAVP
jgi:chromosome segregation ATPase